MDKYDEVFSETQDLCGSHETKEPLEIQEYARRVEELLIAQHKRIKELEDDGKSDLLQYSIVDKNGRLYSPSNRPLVIKNIQAIPSRISPPRTHRRLLTVLPELVQLGERAFDLQDENTLLKQQIESLTAQVCPAPGEHKALLEHIFKLTNALAINSSLESELQLANEQLTEAIKQTEEAEKELEEGGCPDPLAHQAKEDLENFLIDLGYQEGVSGWEKAPEETEEQ